MPASLPKVELTFRFPHPPTKNAFQFYWMVREPRDTVEFRAQFVSVSGAFALFARRATDSSSFAIKSRLISEFWS